MRFGQRGGKSWTQPELLSGEIPTSCSRGSPPNTSTVLRTTLYVLPFLYAVQTSSQPSWTATPPLSARYFSTRSNTPIPYLTCSWTTLPYTQTRNRPESGGRRAGVSLRSSKKFKSPVSNLQRTHHHGFSLYNLLTHRRNNGSLIITPSSSSISFINSISNSPERSRLTQCPTTSCDNKLSQKP